MTRSAPPPFSIENFDSSIYKSEGIVVLLKFDLVFVLFLRVLLVKFSWHEFAARYMFDLTTESVPPIRMISKIFSSPRPLCWNCGYKFTSIWINRYKIQCRLRTPIQLNDDQGSPLFLYELIFDDFWCRFYQYVSITRIVWQFLLQSSNSENMCLNAISVKLIKCRDYERKIKVVIQMYFN